MDTELNPEDFIQLGIQEDLELSPEQDLDIVTQPSSDEIDIISVKSTSPAQPPRIDPDSIETISQAETFFYNEVCRRYRFNMYENALENLTKDEIIDAIYDSLEEINETTPQTDYTLLSLVQRGRRYRRLMIIGAGKYSIITLISHWSSNGIDVQVEDLSLSSKLGDFQSLLSTLQEQFAEKLKELKAYDRLAIKQSAFSTGRLKYGNINGYSRLSALTQGGRRLS